METPPIPNGQSEKIRVLEKKLEEGLSELGSKLEKIKPASLTEEEVAVLKEKLHIAFGVVAFLVGKEMLGESLDFMMNLDMGLAYGENAFEVLINNLDQLSQKAVGMTGGVAGLGGIAFGMTEFIKGTKSFVKRMWERAKKRHAEMKDS